MGVEYSPFHVAECWACDDGFMTGRRYGKGDVKLECRRCENAFPASLNGDTRVETIGLAYNAELDLGNMESLDDVVATAQSADGMVVLELGESRPLYYQLKKGDACPVRSCGGTLRQTGSRRTTQQSCDTCDFETFEKDVS